MDWDVDLIFTFGFFATLFVEEDVFLDFSSRTFCVVLIGDEDAYCAGELFLADALVLDHGIRGAIDIGVGDGFGLKGAAEDEEGAVRARDAWALIVVDGFSLALRGIGFRIDLSICDDERRF